MTRMCSCDWKRAPRLPRDNGSLALQPVWSKMLNPLEDAQPLGLSVFGDGERPDRQDSSDYDEPRVGCRTRLTQCPAAKEGAHAQHSQTE